MSTAVRAAHRMPTPDRLHFAILLSLAGHALVLLTALLVSHLRYPSLRARPETYQVRLVSLGGGKVSAPPAPSKDLPKATVQELKQATTKALPAPVPKPAPKTQPKEMKLKSKDLKKELAALEREVKAKDAAQEKKQAELDAQLDSITAKNAQAAAAAPKAPSAAGTGGEGKGGSSEGNADLSAAAAFALGQYKDQVRALVLAAWNLPAWTAASLPENTFAVVLVYIAEDGTITRTEFERPSNIQFFDQSALRAVRRSSPLPPPPKDLAEEAKTKGIALRFSPKRQ